MKTKEELNALKEELETLNKKLAELTEEELQQVSGGGRDLPCGIIYVRRNPSGRCEDFARGHCLFPDSPCYFR